MIGMNILLGVFILLFAVIGFVRGASREGLVTSAMLLGLYVITIFEMYVPIIKDYALQPGGITLAIRIGVLFVMAYIGYQTPSFALISDGERFTRRRWIDVLLGIFLGATNGYLIFGSLWCFLENNGNPFPIIAQAADPSVAAAASQFIPYLPPNLLAEPVIYFAVAMPLFILLAIFI